MSESYIVIEKGKNGGHQHFPPFPHCSLFYNLQPRDKTKDCFDKESNDYKYSSIIDEDLCYNGDGSDGSYAGEVNYAKSFDPCVPWYKATKCLFNKFDSK